MQMIISSTMYEGYNTKRRINWKNLIENGFFNVFYRNGETKA